MWAVTAAAGVPNGVGGTQLISRLGRRSEALPLGWRPSRHKWLPWEGTMMEESARDHPLDLQLS